jgi:hypothetical protein
MRTIFCILICWISVVTSGQTESIKLEKTIKEFHQALVLKNTVSLNQQTDKALSYGHSNGWVELKTDLLKNIETGYLDYKEFTEDSLSISINGNMANARFIANIDVALNGKQSLYRLKVLEVWVKKGKRWILFARQAVK